MSTVCIGNFVFESPSHGSRSRVCTIKCSNNIIIYSIKSTISNLGVGGDGGGGGGGDRGARFGPAFRFVVHYTLVEGQSVSMAIILCNLFLLVSTSDTCGEERGFD